MIIHNDIMVDNNWSIFFFFKSHHLSSLSFLVFAYLFFFPETFSLLYNAKLWHKKRKPALFFKQILALNNNELITKVIVAFHLCLVFSHLHFLPHSLLLSLSLLKFNPRKLKGASEWQTWISHMVSIAFAKDCNSCSKHIVPSKTKAHQWRLN